MFDYSKSIVPFIDILFIHPREIFERNVSANMDHVAEPENVVRMVLKSMAIIVTWPSAERGRQQFTNIVTLFVS
jgi:hypothetical protein